MTNFDGFLKDKAFIDGVWWTGHAQRVFAVSDPATGAVIANIPDMDAQDAEEAVKAAHGAFALWREKTAKERGVILKAWHQLIVDNVDALARLLTTEQGKPLAEARGEILSGAAAVDWSADEARRLYGETIPSHKNDAKAFVIKQPVGVVGAITPWNFPSSMITRKLGPALAAGCTVVLKPAEDAPLSALALAALAERAGFPKGVINIVTSSRDSAAAIGKVLSSHPLIAKVSFTGSTAVGKILLRQAADGVKRASMELGGNAPFIVFDSADLDKAADGAIICKFRNAGQTCICANRIYVQDGVHDAFVAKLAARIARLKIGHGLEEGTQIGPLINEKGLEKVEAHVADAVAQGAILAYGGERNRAAGVGFYSPTLLTGMTSSMRLKSEETFGPVAGIFRFKTEEEVIFEANDTNYGLSAYFYTSELGQAFRVSERLEYGMVGVNEPLIVNEAYPFGGFKESGIGRENAKYGIEEFVEIKYILLGNLNG